MTGHTRRKHDKKTDGAVDGGQRDTMKTHKHVNSDDLFKWRREQEDRWTIGERDGTWMKQQSWWNAHFSKNHFSDFAHFHELSCIDEQTTTMLTLLLVALLPRPPISSCSSRSSLWGARPAGRWWTRTSWPLTRWRRFLCWLHRRRREKQLIRGKSQSSFNHPSWDWQWECRGDSDDSDVAGWLLHLWKMQSTELCSSWLLIVRQSSQGYCERLTCEAQSSETAASSLCNLPPVLTRTFKAKQRRRKKEQTPPHGLGNCIPISSGPTVHTEESLHRIPGGFRTGSGPLTKLNLLFPRRTRIFD